MWKKSKGILAASFIVAFVLNSFSFVFLTHSTDYSDNFDWEHVQQLGYEEAAEYSAENVISLTGLETVRAGKADIMFWSREIGYLLTYMAVGVLACGCYLRFFTKKNE